MAMAGQAGKKCIKKTPSKTQDFSIVQYMGIKVQIFFLWATLSRFLLTASDSAAHIHTFEDDTESSVLNAAEDIIMK